MAYVGVAYTALHSKIHDAGDMAHNAAGVTTQGGGVTTHAMVRMRLIDVLAPTMMRSYTYHPKTVVEKGIYAKPDTQSRGLCGDIPAGIHVL